MSAAILIVEDSRTQAEALRFLLTDAGHEVLTARDGEQALEAMRAHAPALVVTDVIMPRMDGYTLTRVIKADDELRDTPVILLTSLATPRDVVEGLACGADNFIRKPYEPDHLLERVESILDNHRLRREQLSPVGTELSFGGERHVVTAEREQVLDFLVSSFEEAVHLDGELTRSHRSIDSLYRIAEGLNRCTTEAEVTAEALDRVLELPGVQAAWILVREGDALRLSGMRAPAGCLPDRQALEGDGECGRRLLASAPPGAVNLASCECLGAGSNGHGPHGHASVPLWTGAGVLGVMNLIGPDDGQFGDDELRGLQGVGTQVAAALERALLQEHLERRVQERTEALTTEIAARRRAETALRSLAAIVESSHDAMVRLTPDGHVVTWNPAAERLYGYSATEAIGRSVSMLVPPDRHDEMTSILARVRDGDSVQGYETMRQTRAGRALETSLTVSPVRDADGAIVGLAEIARDITAAKDLERQFLQAQKMESVGRLAGGIAHDFNNLMTAVLGFSDLLLMRIEGETEREYVGEVKRSGERAAKLTQQLLAFARRQVQRPEVLVLDDVIAELEPMLERLIGDDVELVTSRAPDPWRVKVDRSHVDQVVMNLAVNARDAMPDGGRLDITTSNAKLDAGYAAAHLGVEPGRYVLMSVSDTGVGMDEETQARIFEPFFTTKEEGKGSGLGLATVIGIVEQSGGHLRVYSEPGHGTTFRIYLPTTAENERPERRAPASASTGEPRGTETVMVVEDDEGIRRLLLRILSDGGYDVLVADGPKEALSLSAARAEPIDLLITDMIMPGMTGREVADRLTADRPGMRVLFMSGYTGDAMIHRGLLEPGAYFLVKPFSPVRLAETLRVILDDDS